MPELHQQAQNFGRVFFRERQPLWEIKQRKERGGELFDAQSPIWEGGLVPTLDYVYDPVAYEGYTARYS